jgi:hypothetical protein
MAVYSIEGIGRLDGHFLDIIICLAMASILISAGRLSSVLPTPRNSPVKRSAAFAPELSDRVALKLEGGLGLALLCDPVGPSQV